MLIAVTGCTGLTMPDRPFNDPRNGEPIMAKPNLNMAGRTAGSPDNAQGTHFFMINDSGTYFLRKLPPADAGASVLDAATRCSRGRAQAKVQLLDHRIDVPDGNRDFPAYLDSNRFLSNLPGTTILFPVVDLSRQYINGMMYLLTQPDGARPTIVDDRNFYRPAGVKKWVKNGFLNKDIKLPLGAIWLDAHPDRGRPAAAEPVADRRRDGARRLDPRLDLRRRCCSATRSSRKQYGPMLGFDCVDAAAGSSIDILRWQVPLPQLRQPARQPGRAAPQGRAPDQGDVPAQLRQHGRRRSTRWSPTSSARTASTRDEATVRADLQGRVRRRATSRRRATTPRT